jgi:hypothetical protein
MLLHVPFKAVAGKLGDRNSQNFNAPVSHNVAVMYIGLIQCTCYFFPNILFIPAVRVLVALNVITL